jgi:hypothetical protein
MMALDEEYPWRIREGGRVRIEQEVVEHNRVGELIAAWLRCEYRTREAQTL